MKMRAHPGREHRSDVTEIDADVTEAISVLREALEPKEGSVEDTALCSVETFIVVALRVFAKTNPSKLRSEVRTVELKARLDGIPVVRGAA